MAVAFKTVQIPLPLPAKLFLDKYGWALTPYERYEIKSHTFVYYYGQNMRHKLASYRLRKQTKFLTLNGFYRHAIHDHIEYRFEILCVLGEGSYGRVFKAYDHRFNKIVALKCVNNRIQSQPMELMRESLILNYLKDEDDNCDYVIELQDEITFRNSTFLVLEIMHSDLYQVICNQKSQPFTPLLINKFAYSMFLCVNYIKIRGIIHGDIKPENLFVVDEGKPRIKIGDVGRSCFEWEIDVRDVRPTLYYQAPEVIFGGPITSSVDLWAAACVLTEMVIGYPIFSGYTDDEVVSTMIERLGVPPSSFLSICDPYQVARYIDQSGDPTYCGREIYEGESVLTAQPTWYGAVRYLPGELPLNNLLPDADPELLDFLTKCFQWDICDRMTIEMALHHPYLRRCLPSTDPNEIVPFLKSSNLPKSYYNSVLNLSSARENNNRCWSMPF